MSSSGALIEEDYLEAEKRTGKRGFAKIDVVDVILSSEAQQHKNPATTFEQLTEITLTKFHKIQRSIPSSACNVSVPQRYPVLGTCCNRFRLKFAKSYSVVRQGLQYAPTYRTEPKKKFDVAMVSELLKEFMDKHCSEFSYNEKEGQNACKRISYYIRRAVKQLSFDRYRFICQVRIIEKQNQGVESHVGFLWDENFDGYSSYCVDTYGFVAQAVVYGVYKE